MPALGRSRRRTSVAPTRHPRFILGVVAVLTTVLLLLNLRAYRVPVFARAFAAQQPSRRRGGTGASGGRSGFGARASTGRTNRRTTTTTSGRDDGRYKPLLTPRAEELLRKHSGNVDAATEEYYQTQLAELLLRQPSDGSDSSDLIHSARVRAAWDAVALFRPCDLAHSGGGGTLDAFVQRRMRFIARAGLYGCGLDNDDGPALSQRPLPVWRVLDVGCGDGALVPHLMDCAGSTAVIDYVGMDVSPEMVALAKKRHGNAAATKASSTPHTLDFRVGSFPKDVPAGDTYDCVLFNGSLQFFADPRHALAAARRCLADGASSPLRSGDRNGNPPPRIVIAHVLGAKFVRRECRSHPPVALRPMPKVASELGDMANDLDLRLHTKDDLIRDASASDDKEDWHDSDRSDDNFYLAVLTLD